MQRWDEYLFHLCATGGLACEIEVSVALRFGLLDCIRSFPLSTLSPFLVLSAFPIFSMQSWLCPVPTCKKVCLSPGGLTQHLNHKHRHHEDFGKRETTTHRVPHPILDGR